MRAGSSSDPLPLVGMAGEQHDGVADELRHRLGAGAAEQRREAGDLLVVEAGLDAVAAVDGHLGEPAEHVVARVRRASRRELVEVAGHLERRPAARSGVGSMSPGSRCSVDVEPLADLLALALGHAEHPGDDLDGERRREVGHGVELVAVVERVEEAPDDLADHRLEGGHRPRREHPAHEGPQPVVLGRVHHDDAA